nr:immunoglobulin heavy chain junction region [Mus musculus]MBK4183935.1 immunoglobulin heavy chain junction region [Mus musculus]MBK4186280.1 immunoglobulin heavy chain junction region [Mus musculus]MBK4186807.1 immunoglobulin heavy chain junction region [Mus musculus]MBK4186808.1 immunoglobulin heavy chain junction region [Mus musculus]
CARDYGSSYDYAMDYW